MPFGINGVEGGMPPGGDGGIVGPARRRTGGLAPLKFGCLAGGFSGSGGGFRGLHVLPGLLGQRAGLRALLGRAHGVTSRRVAGLSTS